MFNTKKVNSKCWQEFRKMRLFTHCPRNLNSINNMAALRTTWQLLKRWSIKSIEWVKQPLLGFISKRTGSKRPHKYPFTIVPVITILITQSGNKRSSHQLSRGETGHVCVKDFLPKTVMSLDTLKHDWNLEQDFHRKNSYFLSYQIWNTSKIGSWLDIQLITC